MDGAFDFRKGGPISELAIVDTFTKLIFGEEDQFSPRELTIIQAFRLVDPGVALDSHRDMGQYLRALGVAEMIDVVSQVRACLAAGLHSLAQGQRESILDRRAH